MRHPKSLNSSTGEHGAAPPDHAQREEEPEGGRGLDEARVEAAFVVGHVFGHVGGGPSVFTTEREALKKAEGHEQDGSEQPEDSPFHRWAEIR